MRSSRAYPPPLPARLSKGNAKAVISGRMSLSGKMSIRLRLLRTRHGISNAMLSRRISSTVTSASSPFAESVSSTALVQHTALPGLCRRSVTEPVAQPHGRNRPLQTIDPRDIKGRQFFVRVDPQQPVCIDQCGELIARVG